jgi:hypothetical protein
MNELRLRGIAIPYGHTVIVPGGVERIEPRAFRSQIISGRPCELVLDSHEADAAVIATTRDYTLELFEGPGGLHFEADVLSDIDGYEQLESLLRWGSYKFCSVKFAERNFEVIDCDGFEGVESVTRASIAHIALLQEASEAAFGFTTACWNAARELVLDSRLSYEADRWHQAYACRSPAIRQASYTPHSLNARGPARSGGRIMMSADLQESTRALADALIEWNKPNMLACRASLLRRLR